MTTRDAMGSIDDARRAWAVIEAAGIVTQAEIADRLEVSRAYASEIAKRSDFPQPVYTVGKRAIWLWIEVLDWHRGERKRGRPAAP